MHVATGPRPRLLVVDADAAWRQRLREQLGHPVGIGEAQTLEEALGWLEGRAPGLTVLAVTADDPLAEQAVARIHELHAGEIVVLVAQEPTVELCRRAMRAGAFDVVSRAAATGPGFDRTLADAAGRLLAAQSRRRRRHDVARDAVARHEREAAAGLIEHRAASGAWSRLDPTERRAWVGRYLKAAAGDAAEQAAFVRELGEELAPLDQPQAVAIALHVHAVTTAQTGRTAQVPPQARNLCIDLLAGLLDVYDPRGLQGTNSREVAAIWHRWRLEGTEHWWLVLDGHLRAQVVAGPSGIEGVWLAEPQGRVLHRAGLPALPEALREIERRVGAPYVLDVAPAEDI